MIKKLLDRGKLDSFQVGWEIGRCASAGVGVSRINTSEFPWSHGAPVLVYVSGVTVHNVLFSCNPGVK
jgi:hypothetical protein